MNNQEITKVAAKIAMVNTIYGITQSNEAVMYQANLLREFDLQKVIQAFDKFMVSNKTNRPPTPAHIIELINPIESLAAKADIIISRIETAIRRFGYTEPEEAKEYIGELGWQIVQFRGGWNYLCQHLGTNLLPGGTFHAQARETVKALIEKNDREESLLLEGADDTKILTTR